MIVYGYVNGVKIKPGEPVRVRDKTIVEIIREMMKKAHERISPCVEG